MRALPACALIVTVPCASDAGPYSYICEIEGFFTAIDSIAWLGDEAMETSVAIDRDTGLVIHPVIGNSGISDVTLLNRGSEDWAFKVIADTGGGGNVVYHEVLEYVDGSDKPLLAIAGSIAYWGTCR
ncbi:hypothetical protein HKCCE3408_05135 [Rhodobacterales bacterium HKCCE3408]|nr:hypothetical protein [Rhodobacterales bacterium HKCCE3408]